MIPSTVHRNNQNKWKYNNEAVDYCKSIYIVECGKVVYSECISMGMWIQSSVSTSDHFAVSGP